MSDIIDHNQMNPAELQSELLNFVGGIYGQISEYDKNLVGPNVNLRPMKNQFHQIAQTVLTDIPNANVRRINPQQPPQHHPQQQNQPFIDQGSVPTIHTDPNQLEFNFDNSVTAKTIFDKLDDLEKKIKKIDVNLQRIVNLLNEPENTQ